MHLKCGDKLQEGRYEIVKVLGTGGFGITYLAMQVGLKRYVAIKEFFMQNLCNRDAESNAIYIASKGGVSLVERFKQKFLKEARNIASLNHRNIVSIVDVFEDNGTAYYVMEYIERGSLEDCIKKHGRLREEKAIRYIVNIASALEYIHERRIMHLDIKPANILLNGYNEAVLIDFGLSKQYDKKGSQTSTTPVGISHGYAPIEQYNTNGVGSFYPATDIYSLGATLYRLLTGKVPPTASDINNDGIPKLPADISQRAANAINAAMQPRRNDRPQSISEFLEILGIERKEEKRPKKRVEEVAEEDIIIVCDEDIVENSDEETRLAGEKRHNEKSNKKENDGELRKELAEVLSWTQPDAKPKPIKNNKRTNIIATIFSFLFLSFCTFFIFINLLKGLEAKFIERYQEGIDSVNTAKNIEELEAIDRDVKDDITNLQEVYSDELQELYEEDYDEYSIINGQLEIAEREYNNAYRRAYRKLD